MKREDRKHDTGSGKKRLLQGLGASLSIACCAGAKPEPTWTALRHHLVIVALRFSRVSSSGK